MRLKTTFALCCALALSVPNSQAVTAHWQDPQYIEQSFMTIAMQREYGPASERLNKWQSAVHYVIDDRTADTLLHQQMVTQQLRHLASITGLKITPAGSQAANLKIIFAKENQLDRILLEDVGLKQEKNRHSLLHDSVCVAAMGVADDGAIQQGTVVIPVDRARAHAKLMACVVEELTQVMGLPNDSAEVWPSVFNDRAFNDFLTGLDYLLLKLLYDKSLTTGMSSVQVQKQVHQLLSQPDYQALIPRAQQAVREQSLENWLD